MRKIKHLFRQLWQWIFSRGPEPYVVSQTEDEPKKLKPRKVYLLGEPGHEWVAVFLCPCGCSEVIRLNLLKHGDRPTWQVQREPKNRLSLTPSVWRNGGCRSHFFLTHGHIRWV